MVSVDQVAQAAALLQQAFAAIQSVVVPDHDQQHGASSQAAALMQKALSAINGHTAVPTHHQGFESVQGCTARSSENMNARVKVQASADKPESSAMAAGKGSGNVP